MIKRDYYMSKISPFIGVNLIKVLTGIRRSGKSVMLKLIQNELYSRGVKESEIFEINFEDISSEIPKKAEDLHELILNKKKVNKSLKYLFLDEIQEVKDWEKCVNSLLSKDEFDIYITGSNARLLSSELATYLTGRYVEIHVYPFSFKEFVSLNVDTYGDNTLDDQFNRYILIGGFPFLSHFATDTEAVSLYLNDIYNSVLVKDVIKRNKIRNVDLLERVLHYVIAHVGESFSANSISKYFKSEGRKVAPETVMNLLKACEEAFLFHRVNRYDLVGKHILQVNEKFFLSDHGLRQALYGSNMRDIQRVLENIVYMELLRRGFKVAVGRVNQLEVDFVCEKAGQKKYIQVSYLLASEETIGREFGSLELIQDNYPKYVLSMDKINMSRSGIVHENIIDFLMKDDF